jgi:hypothetical protein
VARAPAVGGGHKAPARKPKPAPVAPASRQHLSRSSKDTARAVAVAAAAEAKEAEEDEVWEDEVLQTSTREKRRRPGVSWYLHPVAPPPKLGNNGSCADGSSQGWSLARLK